jgi:autotransporter-associated beta strand protein
MRLNAPGSLSFATFNLNVGSMSGNSPIDLGSGTLTTGGDNTSTTYSGIISDAGTLVKTGTGTLSLTGSNSYTGPTIINQGNLVVNGSLANPVSVNSGGSLGGTGYLSNVSVSPSGQVAPGKGPQGLTISGSLSLASNAVMEIGPARIQMPLAATAGNFHRAPRRSEPPRTARQILTRRT